MTELIMLDESSLCTAKKRGDAAASPIDSSAADGDSDKQLVKLLKLPASASMASSAGGMVDRASAT